MTVLFDDKDDVEKKMLFEQFLTYRRRMSRCCAIQAIYLYDLNKQVEYHESQGATDPLSSPKDLLKETESLCRSVLYYYSNVMFMRDEYGENRRKRKVDEKYFQTLVYSTLGNLKRIDELIAERLNERWSIETLDMLVRAILRCAVGEAMSNSGTDVPILSSEYTNLTSDFFKGKEIGFVNGIVDRICKSLRRMENI